MKLVACCISSAAAKAQTRSLDFAKELSRIEEVATVLLTEPPAPEPLEGEHMLDPNAKSGTAVLTSGRLAGFAQELAAHMGEGEQVTIQWEIGEG